MTTTTRYDLGDLVHLTDATGPCSHCGQHLDAPLGVVVEHATDQTSLVSLIDRSYPSLRSQGVCNTQGLACARHELTPAEVGDVVHGHPRDIAAAIDAGWLPPGTEFYGCEFRIVQARRDGSPHRA